MAINPESLYPGKIAPSSADYPYGAARNITTPGDGTGTPWEAALVNDLFGFFQALLVNSGQVPTGAPDSATASQYFTGLAVGAEPADNFRLFNRWSAAEPRYIAHRGSPAFPENTVPAILAARGVTDVEFDIRLTADNEWVLMHDDTVDRTTDGTGLISSLSLATVRTLDAGSWKNSYFAGTRVPTLDEALLACRRAGLRPVVELKVFGASDSNRQKVIDSCVKFCDGYNFVLAAGGVSELQAYRALDKRVNVLLFDYGATPLADAKTVYPVIAGLNVANVRSGGAAYVKTYHDAGINTIAFTLDGSATINEMLGYGVGGVLADNLTGAKI